MSTQKQKNKLNTSAIQHINGHYVASEWKKSRHSVYAHQTKSEKM